MKPDWNNLQSGLDPASGQARPGNPDAPRRRPKPAAGLRPVFHPGGSF
jgi:hypothetical protein